MNDYTALLVFKFIKFCLRYNLSRHMKRWKLRQYKNKNCYICGEYIKYKDRSVDHLIPVSVALHLEIPIMIYDERNYVLTHKNCNAKKSHSLAHLSPSITEILENRAKQLNREVLPDFNARTETSTVSD